MAILTGNLKEHKDCEVDINGILKFMQFLIEKYGALKGALLIVVFMLTAGCTIHLPKLLELFFR